MSLCHKCDIMCTFDISVESVTVFCIFDNTLFFGGIEKYFCKLKKETEIQS